MKNSFNEFLLNDDKLWFQQKSGKKNYSPTKKVYKCIINAKKINFQIIFRNWALINGFFGKMLEGRSLLWSSTK